MGGTQQKTTPTTADLASSRFCYRIGPNLILMETGVLAEILTDTAVYPVPFAPAWCAGLVSLRGDLYPVVDMHKVVLGNPKPGISQLLLFQHPHFPPVVLTCDGYPNHLKLSAEDLTEHEDAALPGWIPHTLRHRGQTLLKADHGRLLRQIQQHKHPN